MSVVNRSRKLVSSVFSVFLEQTGGFRSVSSIPKSRCYRSCSTQRFTANVASCQQWHLVASSFTTKRCYSEGSECRGSQSTGSLDEESHETESSSSGNSSLRQRSSQTFTLDVLVSLLRQENAVDLCVIKIPEQVKYAEYFIVVSGVSTRHIRAMALYAVKVYKFWKKAGDPNVRIEGKDAEDWMCIDFGNMIVHFMLPETREIYELEKLWTLRTYDKQLGDIPAEVLPEDFMLDVEVTK